MEFLTGSILSGLLYDGVKSGGELGAGLLKSQLQGWLIDDEKISRMAKLIADAGINDELNSRAIEKRIEASPALLALIKEVNNSNTTVNQSTTVGHNINNTGGGSITIGDTSHK